MSTLSETNNSVDTEEKQLATNNDKSTSDGNKQVDNSQEVTQPASLEMADECFQLSMDFFKKNELSDAIDNACKAVSISEEACQDMNDVKLAKYFIQYGKCLLAKIQQTKELFVGDTANTDEKQENNNVENKTTEADDTNNSNSNNNVNNNVTNENDKETKTETTETKITNTNDTTSKKTSGSGKNEIMSDDEEEQEEDIDIDIQDTNNNNNNNDDNNTNGDADGDGDASGNTDDNTFDYDDRAICWDMLDSARVILRMHLESLGVDMESILGAEFEDEESTPLNTMDQTVEMDENENENKNENNTDQDSKTNENQDLADTTSSKTTDNTDATTTTKETTDKKDEKENTTETTDKTDNSANNNSDNNNKNNEQEEEEQEDIDIDVNNDKKNDDQENENENENENTEEIVKYMVELAEVYSLQGDHQLEDNGFVVALQCFQQSLKLKDECDESNRELAYTHYMAAVAASHSEQYDIMEQHCLEAKDLLTDRILTLIDQFENEKYKEKTSDEEMDEDGLIAIVEEFGKEYNGKLESLTKEEKESVNEISDLLDMMQGINDKMECELADARELNNIPELQGQSIKDLVMQMMMQNGTPDENDNGNDNDNSNGNNNNSNDSSNDNKNNNNNNDKNENLSIKVSGISFGSVASNDENLNCNGNTMTVDTQPVNTLTVKSRKARKRSLETAGIPNDEPSPMKKPKMSTKPKETNLVSNVKE